MLVEKKFNSLEDAKKIYPQLAADNNRKHVLGVDDKIYFYYGKISEKQSLCWRISRLFQLILASFILPLGCCIKPYRDFLSRKINEIKHPVKTVECFILKEPEIAPKQDQVNEPKKKMIQDKVALLDDPQLLLDPKPLPEPKPAPKQETLEEGYHQIQEQEITPKQDQVNKREKEMIQDKVALLDDPQLPVPVDLSKPIDIEIPKEADGVIPSLEPKPILEAKPAPKQETLEERDHQIQEQEIAPKQDRIKMFEDEAALLDDPQLPVPIDNLSKLREIPKEADTVISLLDPKPILEPKPVPKQETLEERYHQIQELMNVVSDKPEFNAENQKIITKFFQALEPDEILLILQQVKDPIDLNKLCITMLSTLQNVQDPTVQLKLTTILRYVRDKYAKKKQIEFKDYDKILNVVFDKMESFEQLYHFTKYITEKGLVFGDKVLQIIYKKNWINAFINKNDFASIKECLKVCVDHKIYFALKNELVKENKYDEFVANLDRTGKDRLDIVTEKGFMGPLRIDLNTSIIDHNDQPINVIIYKTIREKDGNQIYELRTDDDVKLGEVSLKSTKNGLLIPHYQLEAFQKVKEKVTYTNVVQALHEFAVRQSFEMGLQGHVAIYATADLASLHFLSGYHFQDSLAFTTWIIESEPALKNLIIRYFEALNKKESTEQILHQIKQFEKNVKNPMNNSETNINRAFRDIRAKAKKNLKVKPKDMQEVLEHGVYFDKNSYMKKVLTNYPLHHKKLRPLLLELEYARAQKQDTKDILQKIENLKNEGDDQIQKILEKGKKLAEKNTKNPNLECIAHYLAQYKPKKFEGRMYLPDESIEKWKKIIEQKK